MTHSRRDFLVKGASFIGAMYGLNACSDQPTPDTVLYPAETSNTETEFLKTVTAIQKSGMYAIRSAVKNSNPFFRAASGVLYAYDQAGDIVSGSVFPYINTKGNITVGTVTHVASNATQSNGKAAIQLQGVPDLLHVPAGTTYTKVSNFEDGFVSLELPVKALRSIESAVSAGELALLELAQQMPQLGEVVKIANGRTGEFDAYNYGPITAGSSSQNTTLYAERAVETVGFVPSTVAEHNDYVQEIISGIYPQLATTIDYACNGDSGSAVLNIRNAIVGVVQSIDVNRPNEYGQLCSPIVRIA